jgi:hypothetical protein
MGGAAREVPGLGLACGTDVSGRIIALALAASILLSCVCCSTPPGSRAGQVNFDTALSTEGEGGGSFETFTRAQLEDEILRFEGRFSALVTDAFRSFARSPSPALRRQAARLKLGYLGSALDIAMGSLPEQNLLDMVVFVQLIRDAFRDYWLPEVFKGEGQPILAALETASHSVKRLSAVYLTPAQQGELKALILGWHRQYPGVVAVESVRLSDFSGEAGARATQLEDEISGILAPVAGATAAADRALLLGERGLYFAQRAPFLVRLQSTAALQEAIEEVKASFSDFPLTYSDLVVLKEVLGETHVVLRGLKRLPEQVQGLSVAVLIFGVLLTLFAGVVYVVARLTYDRLSAARKPAPPESREKRRVA